MLFQRLQCFNTRVCACLGQLIYFRTVGSSVYLFNCCCDTPSECLYLFLFPPLISQVFFRSGVLGALEAKRDDLLSDRVIQLQAHCRGYLARRRLARRRLQELAVKCIQRNVRAFLKVRDWPWWRLLVRVTPLLAVHRTEEQLKAATVELQQVRAKLEKIESERNELKATNHKLEARVS